MNKVIFLVSQQLSGNALELYGGKQGQMGNFNLRAFGFQRVMERLWNIHSMHID